MGPDNTKCLAEHIGNRIKFYRTQRNLSQEQLAKSIFKSKSTLCKYESGQISIDIETLYHIASVLRVELSQFVDYAIPTASEDPPPLGTNLVKADFLNMYYYDGRTNRITQTLLELDHARAESNSIPCRCYMDIPSFGEYEQCKYFYIGTMTQYEMLTYVMLYNQFNRTERITLSILNPFHQTQRIWGIMLAISFNPITPFAIKVLISPRPLTESVLQSEVMQSLTLSKDDLKMIKKLNMVILNTSKP